MSAGLIILGFAVLTALWFLPAYLMRRYQERSWRAVCQKEGLIVLTFDDGPGKHLTLQLNELMGGLGIVGTFFMIGNRAQSFPDAVDIVAKSGNEIGGHSAQHYNAWKSLPQTHCRDMMDGQHQVSELAGQTNLFRPPFGKMSLASYLLAKYRGLDIGWWTVDARDAWVERRPHEDVLDEIRRNKGGIVLLHDFDSVVEGHDQYVLSLIPKIHDLASELNLRFVTFSEFLKLSEGRVTAQ